jgi:alkylation response protein AidB-like acyl-CoA dehydrogenase
MRDLVRKAGELGLSGVDIPEQYGGMQLDKVTSALIADRLSKYGSFSTTWGAHTCIGTLPIVYFGTEDQKKKYLPGLASGETVGAYALSESSSASDALNCRTRAQLSAADPAQRWPNKFGLDCRDPSVFDGCDGENRERC